MTVISEWHYNINIIIEITNILNIHVFKTKPVSPISDSRLDANLYRKIKALNAPLLGETPGSRVSNSQKWERETADSP